MANLNKHKTTMIILVLTIVSLSCGGLPPASPLDNDGNTQQPQETVKEIASSPGVSGCNATQYLRVSSEITLQETNQFGTRACEYRLKIVNTHPDQAVWFYIYQHDKDGYANTEKSRWMGNVKVEPDREEEWTGSIYIYTDKDANGPLMSIPEKLAGVFDSPECAEVKQDENYFEKVFIQLHPVCPME